MLRPVAPDVFTSEAAASGAAPIVTDMHVLKLERKPDPDAGPENNAADIATTSAEAFASSAGTSTTADTTEGDDENNNPDPPHAHATHHQHDPRAVAAAERLFAMVEVGDRIEVVELDTVSTVLTVRVTGRTSLHALSVEPVAQQNVPAAGSRAGAEPRSEAEVRRYHGCGFRVRRSQTALFEYQRATGNYYFGERAREPNVSTDDGLELAKRLRHFGRLVALALFNHCKLGILLPAVFFEMLLRPDHRDRLTMDDVDDRELRYECVSNCVCV